MQQNTTLKSLVVSDVFERTGERDEDERMGKSIGTILAAGIVGNSTLESLVIRSNELGDEGAAILIEAMTEGVDVDETFMKQEDMDFWKQKTLRCGVERLDLADNAIGNAGAVAIFEGLLNPKFSLKELYIGDNKVRTALFSLSLLWSAYSFYRLAKSLWKGCLTCSLPIHL